MSGLADLVEPVAPSTLVNLKEYASAVEAVQRELEGSDAAARVWAKDGTWWAPEDRAVAREIEDRLGWLGLPIAMRSEVARLKALAAEAKQAGLTRVVLLGMGGSSLAPEVMAAVLPRDSDGAELVILDATDPTQIRRVEAGAPLANTLFILASKSGTTIETDSLYAYFRTRLQQAVGPDAWRSHWVAITDPYTALAELAVKERFRALFTNPPDIGGRYSALSLFGLVPAALCGIDIDALLLAAQDMYWACRGTAPIATHPGMVLGAIMGACAQAQPLPVDKLTLFTSPRLAPFGPWAEQLIAESTGKDGVGILPVEGECLACLPKLSRDRLLVYLRLTGDANEATDALAQRLSVAGHPLVVLTLPEPYALGAEMYRWEYATAVAGQILGINPFDQPNVEAAKKSARAAIKTYEEHRQIPQPAVALAQEGLQLSGPVADAQSLAEALAQVFKPAHEGQYVAVMAYIDRSPEHIAALEAIRKTLGRALGVPVTVGFGPRFLHSTGQLHKGGANNGLFLQIVQDETDDLAIPGRGYTFGVLKACQALGDWQALQEAGRTVVRVNVGADVVGGLARLNASLAAALREDVQP